MSRPNPWHTERRIKAQQTSSFTVGDGLSSADESGTILGTQVLERRPPVASEQSEDSDGEFDDELPGAYAISRRLGNQAVDWDPTEHTQEANTPEMEHPQEYSPLERTEDTPLAFVEAAKKKDEPKWSRRCLFAVLAFVLCCGLVGGVVGFLLLGNKGASDSGDDKVNCETSTDPFLQCEECFQSIQVSDDVEKAYNSLKASNELAYFEDSSMQIESCAPKNIALVWVASEIVAAEKQGLVPSEGNILNRFVLVFLYSAWGGRDWKNKTNWLTSRSECFWYGVSCDGEGRITSLSLPNNNVIGSLETSLGLFQELKTLVLGGNQLNGPIPLEVWSLPSLEELLLGGNSISGTIPVSLGEHTSLNKLSLYENKLTGSLPLLSGLPNLKELSVAYNHLVGTLPGDWGELRLLEILDISNIVALSGTIPSSFGLLTGLKILAAESTGLSGTVSDILGNMISLGK